MEIIHVFGLEKSLFIFQVVNFLIIAFILKKFLYKPLMKMLDERKNKIERSLQDAESAKLALENAGHERVKILSAAKKDAETLAAAAKASLEEQKIQMTDDAKRRSHQMLEDARQKAQAEFESMNKQIGAISVDVSGKVIARVFEGLFTDEEKQKLIARALDKIEKGGYEKNPN